MTTEGTCHSATVADLIQEVITIGGILRDPHFAWGVLGGSAFVGLLVRAVLATWPADDGDADATGTTTDT